MTGDTAWEEAKLQGPAPEDGDRGALILRRRNNRPLIAVLRVICLVVRDLASFASDQKVSVRLAAHSWNGKNLDHPGPPSRRLSRCCRCRPNVVVGRGFKVSGDLDLIATGIDPVELREILGSVLQERELDSNAPDKIASLDSSRIFPAFLAV